MDALLDMLGVAADVDVEAAGDTSCPAAGAGGYVASSFALSPFRASSAVVGTGSDWLSCASTAVAVTALSALVAVWVEGNSAALPLLRYELIVSLMVIVVPFKHRFDRMQATRVPYYICMAGLIADFTILDEID